MFALWGWSLDLFQSVLAMFLFLLLGIGVFTLLPLYSESIYLDFHVIQAHSSEMIWVLDEILHSIFRKVLFKRMEIFEAGLNALCMWQPWVHGTRYGVSWLYNDMFGIRLIMGRLVMFYIVSLVGLEWPRQQSSGCIPEGLFRLG